MTLLKLQKLKEYSVKIHRHFVAYRDPVLFRLASYERELWNEVLKYLDNESLHCLFLTSSKAAWEFIRYTNLRVILLIDILIYFFLYILRNHCQVNLCVYVIIRYEP